MNPHVRERKNVCDMVRYFDVPGGTRPHINERIITDFRDPLNGSGLHRESELHPNGKREVSPLETTVAPLVLVGGPRRGAR
jgi:hypothetical protein